MSKILLAILVLVVACSPDDTADTSTTAATTTTTSTETTPSTMPTTSIAETTTSEATTTTMATTTTTSEELEGNWADQPLITTDFGALGWWDGSTWLSAESEGALPVVGGEDYQIARIGVTATTSGGAQTTVCEPLNNIGVELAAPDLLGEFPGPYGVAISAPWNLVPYLFEEVPDDGTYSGFAHDFLLTRGLDVANPVIKQLFRMDLEGDGINEVVYIAEDVTPGFLMEPGDYSVALMRKVVDGSVQTAVLGETVAMDESDTFSGAYTLGAVADLSGDGKMEILMNEAFFEGFGVTVWEYVNDDLGPVSQLSTGCGS